MNGRYRRDDRREKKKVKPLSFISGGYKADDALVAQSEKYKSDSNKNESKTSDIGGSADVMVSDPPVPSTSKSVNKEGAGQTAEEFASWERHNKGIGSKLLKKMGHEEGKGLGKSAQGIPLPIEAFRRLGRGAIGSYGSETKEIHAEVENKYKLKPWLRDIDNNKRDNNNNKRDRHGGNNRYDNKEPPWLKYKMRQIEKNQRAQKGYHHNKHVDLTNSHPGNIHLSGRQPRGDSLKIPVCRDKGLDMFSRSPSNEVQHIPLPGTEIVIDGDEASEEESGGIVGVIMHGVERNKRRRLALEESMAKMVEEHGKVVEECRKDELVLPSVNQLMQKSNRIVDYCFNNSSLSSEGVTIIDAPTTSSSSSPPSISHLLEACVPLMEEVQKINTNTSRDAFLETILFLTPTLNNIFKDWHPLQNPDHGAEFIRELKYLIETNAFCSDKSEKSEIMQSRLEAYEGVLSKHIVWRLREAMREWRIDNPGVMLSLLNTWTPLLGGRDAKQLYNFIFNVKIRKGLRDVDQSSQSLSDVILPWVPVLGSRIRTLPNHILQKIKFHQEPEMVEVLSDDD